MIFQDWQDILFILFRILLILSKLTIVLGRVYSTFNHIFTSRVIGGKHDSSLHA